MHNKLPKINTPQWLVDVNIQKSRFCLKSIIENSFFYPCCGFDSTPIKYFSGNFYSFIYVDYGVSKQDSEWAIHKNGFRGYHLIYSKEIKESELTTKGWEALRKKYNIPAQHYKNFALPSFAMWYVFQRDKGIDDSHGAEKFSLLYIGAEALVAFDALYLEHNTKPKGIAIIQPGYEFGENWSDFSNPKEIFAQTVLNNSAGIPQFLISGGNGKLKYYKKPCWSIYSKHIDFMQTAHRIDCLGGNIGVWSPTCLDKKKATSMR
jgi:hypothetical protein